MAKYLEWLVVEIERHGKDRLSEEEVRGLVAEVRTHLEEGIRARMDLGLSEEEAEKETVEAFGDPEKVVKEVSRSGKRKSGFIYEKGVTASGGPVMIAGFGNLRVKGYRPTEGQDGL